MWGNNRTTNHQAGNRAFGASDEGTCQTKHLQQIFDVVHLPFQDSLCAGACHLGSLSTLGGIFALAELQRDKEGVSSAFTNWHVYTPF